MPLPHCLSVDSHRIRVLYVWQFLTSHGCNSATKFWHFAIESPLSLISLQYTRYNFQSSCMPRPNISGSYFRITDIVANELHHMKHIIRSNMRKHNVSPENTLVCEIKLADDGMGSVDGIPKQRQKIKLPNKIFRCSLAIVEVKFGGRNLTFWA